MWWKVFDLVPGWIYAAAVAALLLLSGFFYVRMNYAVTSLATYKTEVAENTRKAEQAARIKEQEMQKNADQIAQDAEKRRSDLIDSIASSQQLIGRLRNQIDRLNGRPVPSDPQLAACFGEARATRELLGSCSERYRGMAEEADGLRSQVTGLQDFAKIIRGD